MLCSEALELEKSRAINTWANCDGRFRAFAEFCLKHSHCPLPAEQEAAVHYLGHVEKLYRTTAGRGTHPNHLQINLSSINTTHALAGYEKPALGEFVSSAKDGYMRSLNEAPVPHRGQNMGRSHHPEHIDRLLAAADEGDQACVRETSAIVLAYLFGREAGDLRQGHHQHRHRDRHVDRDQDQDQNGGAAKPL